MTGPGLVGRNTELSRLNDMLSDVGSGSQVLVLRGEPGVGKSALVAAAVSRAAGMGMTVLSAAGVQAEMQVAYAGLHQLLRELLRQDSPEAATARDAVLGALDPSGLAADQPFRVAMVVLDLLSRRAREGPLLLVVDDAQWIDPDTWDVLMALVRRFGSDPVAVLIGMRDGAEANERLERRQLPALVVEPLDDPAARRLLDRCSADLPSVVRTRILAEAAGNPLGLAELAAAATRLGEAALPPSWLPLTTRLEQTFATSVSVLPTTARALLLAAALENTGRLSELVAAAALVEGTAVTAADVAPAVAAGVVDIAET